MMLCPKCNVEMVKGIAIDPERDAYARGIVPQIRYLKDPQLIDVLKCPKCGYSDDGRKNRYE